MKLISTEKRTPYDLLLYVGTLLLLLEWLRPLPYIANIKQLTIFIVFAMICFTLSFFRIHTVLTIPVTFVSMLFLLHTTSLHAFPNGAWITGFSQEILENTKLLWKGNIDELSPLFRTTSFLIGLWVLIALIQLLMKKKQLFSFFVGTILYITILDTFTSFDGKYAIIRTFVLSFLLIGLLYIKRLEHKENILLTNRMWAAFAIPFSCFVLITATFGYVGPKQKPQWADPIHTLNKATGKDTTSKAGYNMHDGELGGAFSPDNTIVFTAETNNKTYWKVETRDIYTGKGWTSSPTTYSTFVNLYNADPSTAKTEHAKIQMNLTSDSLIYPVNLLKIESPPNQSYRISKSERINLMEKEVRFLENAKIKALQSYETTYLIPSFTAEDLMRSDSSTDSFTGQDETTFFTSIQNSYTQLPPSLPQRVVDLATSLTATQRTQFEKAKAIERYLSAFTYETQDVPYPTENQDYVDQFLFESKRGYCNNFSTAMVVLLRANHIPARWVKGYAEGSENTPNHYTITNNNAHSWVEVYFKNYGWVTFEPTRGFNSPYNLEVTRTENVTQTETQTKPQAPTTRQETKEENTADEATPIKKDSPQGTNTILAILLMGTFVVGAYALFYTRVRWLPWLYIIRYQQSKKNATYHKAYSVLLHQLRRMEIEKSENETLREFAHHVDTIFQTTDMQQFTYQYEQILYRSHQEPTLWVQSVPIWKRLMKKTAKRLVRDLDA